MRTYFFEIYIWHDHQEVIEIGNEIANSKREAKQRVIDRYGDTFSEFIACYQIS